MLTRIDVKYAEIVALIIGLPEKVCSTTQNFYFLGPRTLYWTDVDCSYVDSNPNGACY